MLRVAEWPFDVDVVTAVHTPTRPVERAVSSVLDHTNARVRVSVVAHNTDPAAIAARLGILLEDPRVRLLTHEDDYHTPAGPKNVGLAEATAEYVAMLDSDDTLEPGALDAWLEAARGIEGGADAVIAPTTTSAGDIHPSPPVRWHRIKPGAARQLDALRDRLAYRASPLGLIGRARFSHLRFAEGIPTGEDQPVTAELWFTQGSRVVFPAFAPRYLEHHDQDDRVTGVTRSVADEFLSLDRTLAEGTPWARNAQARTAVATKLIRVHLFDALRSRIVVGWSSDNARELASVAERIIAWGPGCVGLLAKTDAKLLNLVREASVEVDVLRSQLSKRQQLRRLDAVLPSKLRFTLHPQAPLRYHLASRLIARRVRRRSVATA